MLDNARFAESVTTRVESGWFNHEFATNFTEKEM